jgi:hypothetical protein
MLLSRKPQHWLESRGADLTGVLERGDLIDLARQMKGEGRSGSGAGAQ